MTGDQEGSPDMTIQPSADRARDQRGRPRLLRRAVVACLLAALLICAAPGGATRIKAAHPWKIAFVSALAFAPFYLTMGHGVQAEAKAEGLPAPEIAGSTVNFDPGHQIPILRAVIRRHPDLILIAPADAVALRAPLMAATKSGIKVILVDTTLKDPTLAITTISTDNIGGGRLAANALASALGGQGGRVAAFAGERGISTTDQRVHGFAEEVKRFPQVRNIGPFYWQDLRPTGTGTAADSYAVTALAAAHKGLAGLFVTWGGASATGSIAAALHQAIKLVEFDAGPEQVAALKAGQIAALIAQYPYGIGQLAVRLGVEFLNGDHKLQQHYATPCAVITAANVNDPALANFLYTQ
jgi:ribose transport system substrate-binding protein